MAPTLVLSLGVRKLVIASIILITVLSGRSISSTVTSGISANDPLHENVRQNAETRKGNCRSAQSLSYVDKGSLTLKDYETHFIAYKDTKWKNCYLEKMQQTALQLTESSKGLVKWRKHFLSPRTLYVSVNSLTKLEAWRLAGGRIVDFCSGMTISLFEETKPIPNWSDDPFFNEIPEDENDIIQKRVADVLLTPLLERTKRKTLLENREALDSKGKEKWGLSQGQRRTRRQAPPSPYRGQFRGQTQSQYLNVDGDGQKEGRAEAEATHESSHAVVSGSSGMGQAQSMSAGGFGCEECPQPASPGGATLYPDAVIRSSTKDTLPTGIRYVDAGPSFTQVGSHGYPGSAGPSPVDNLRTHPFAQTLEPRKPWISPGDTRFPPSSTGVSGTPVSGAGTGPGTGTGTEFGIRSNVYPHSSGGNIPLAGLYPTSDAGKGAGPLDRIVYPSTPGAYHPSNNGIQTSGGNTPGAGLYPDTSITGRGQPDSGGVSGSPATGSVPSQTFYPSSLGKDTTRSHIPESDLGGMTNLPGVNSAIGGMPPGTGSRGALAESQFYPGSPGVNANSDGSYPAGIPPVSGPRESTFYPDTQGGTRVSGSGYPTYYPGEPVAPSGPYFDGRSRGTNGDVQNNRNVGIYPGMPNEGQGPTYAHVPYSSMDARGTYPGLSTGSTSTTSHAIDSNRGRDVYGRQSPPSSGPPVSTGSYPIDKYGGTATGSKTYTGVGDRNAESAPMYPAHSIPSGYPGISGYPGDIHGQMPLMPQEQLGIAGIRGTGGIAGISNGGVDGTIATRFPYTQSSGGQDQRYFGQPSGTGSDGAGVGTPGGVGIINHEEIARGGGGEGRFYPGSQSGVGIPTEGRDTVLYPDGTMSGVRLPGSTSQGRYDGHDSRVNSDRDQYYNQPLSSRPVYPHPRVDGNSGVAGISRGPQNAQGTSRYPSDIPGGGGVGGPLEVGGKQYPNGIGVGPDGVGKFDVSGATDGRYRDGNVGGWPPSGLRPDQPSPYYQGPVGSGVPNRLSEPFGVYGLVPGSGYGTNGGPGSVANVHGIGTDGRALAAGSNVEADADANSQASSSVKQAEKGGTQASASAQGIYGGGTAQSKVSGTYSGGGSFSAQAGTSDANKSAQSQVNGGKEGATSTAQGVGGRGKSNSQVQLNSETGATSTGAQSSGWNHGTNSQVQASSKGGMADAQANGEGSTSSQAQIGFQPYLDRNSNFSERHEIHEQQRPFRGGGSASAQSGTYAGQSQSQIQGSFLYGISYTGAAQAGSGSGAAASRKAFNFSTTDEPLFKKFEDIDPPSISALNGDSSLRSDAANFNLKLEERPIAVLQDIQNQSENKAEPNDRTIQTSSSQRKIVTVAPTGQKEEKSSVWPSSSKDAAYEGGTMTDDYEYEDEEDYDSSAPTNIPHAESSPNVQRNQDPTLTNTQNNNEDDTRNVDNDAVDYDSEHEANSNAQLAQNERLNDNRESTNRRYSSHVPENPLTAIPAEGDVLQPGQSLPGYTIPPGFRGRVTSLPDPTEASDTRNSQSQPALNLSDSHAKNETSPASQTRLLRTNAYRQRSSSTQRKYHSQPSGFTENRMRRPPSHSIPNTYLRANFPTNPNSDADLDTDSSYGRAQRPNYYTVTNSVAGKMDGSRNVPRKYEHRYYTKSSTCGYFTFSCNIVHGSNGRTKICKPKVPTNPDGSPMKC